jgi:hypothetical protein
MFRAFFKNWPWCNRMWHIYLKLSHGLFISDLWSILDPNISVRNPVGSRADEGSDMQKAMLWSFYHKSGTGRHFRKLTIYNVIPITVRDMNYSGTVWYIYIYIYIDQPAKVIVGRCLMDFTRFLLLYHMFKNALSTISIS